MHPSVEANFEGDEPDIPTRYAADSAKPHISHREFGCAKPQPTRKRSIVVGCFGMKSQRILHYQRRILAISSKRSHKRRSSLGNQYIVPHQSMDDYLYASALPSLIYVRRSEKAHSILTSLYYIIKATPDVSPSKTCSSAAVVNTDPASHSRCIPQRDRTASCHSDCYIVIRPMIHAFS